METILKTRGKNKVQISNNNGAGTTQLLISTNGWQWTGCEINDEIILLLKDVIDNKYIPNMKETPHEQ